MACLTGFDEATCSYGLEWFAMGSAETRRSSDRVE